MVSGQVVGGVCVCACACVRAYDRQLGEALEAHPSFCWSPDHFSVGDDGQELPLRGGPQVQRELAW